MSFVLRSDDTQCAKDCIPHNHEFDEYAYVSFAFYAAQVAF